MQKHSFVKKLAESVKNHSSCRSIIYDMYEKLATDREKQFLEEVLSEVAEETDIMKLIEWYALSRRRIDEILRCAIKHAVIVRKGSRECPGAYESFSRPSIQLRSKIFALITENSSMIYLAKECLTYIDTLRDKYGCHEAEARHPNIGIDQP